MGVKSLHLGCAAVLTAAVGPASAQLFRTVRGGARHNSSSTSADIEMQSGTVSDDGGISSGKEPSSPTTNGLEQARHRGNPKGEGRGLPSAAITRVRSSFCCLASALVCQHQLVY